MNATQRKFLVEKIQKKVKDKIEELRRDKFDYPSASNYIFKAILNDTLELQDNATILKALKDKAIKSKEGANWLSNEYMGANKETTIQLLIDELVVVPEDFDKERKRVHDHNKGIDSEIQSLYAQLDTIEVRIQLASDKVLQKLINEVDDMGDISLIDTKIKFLNN